MSRIKRAFLAFAAFALAAVSLPPLSAESGAVEFSIRFYEKRIYYLGDTEHPVLLEALLYNNSSQTYRFRMADNRVFSFDLQLTTPTNVELDHSTEYTRSRTANRPVLYRDISLEPGESYGVILSVPAFITVPKPGVYGVQALFYPELNLRGPEVLQPVRLSGAGAEPPPPSGPSTEPPPVLRSNLLTLNIRPAIVRPEEKARVEAETGNLIRKQPIPPDEVVAYMLTARQKSQWEKFFLYLDLESLYQQHPDRARAYRRMSEEDRRAALARYKEQLRRETVDVDILLIPASFTIERTSYTPFEAEVTVLEKFQYRDYVERKRYTYSLERRDTIWVITGYEIVNLGTE